MTPASPDSRALILDAAEARFAVQGFDSTTIKEIAGDARVNSALLYYYFADKEALYHDVVSRLLERLANEMAQAFAPGMAPDELLRAFILQQGRTLEANPRLRKLVGRELIDHDALHAQAAIRHLAASTFERLRGAIAAGQRAGLFRADLDPRFAAISIVGQTAYFHFARPAVEILLNDGKSLPAGTSDSFARHVADFTLAALAPVKKRAPATKSVTRRAKKLGAALLVLGSLACSAPPTDGIEATGTLEYIETDIAATTGGRVVSVRVQEGDRVKEGDTLVVLTIPSLAADLDQLRARVRWSRANLAEAMQGARPSEITQVEAERAALAAEADRTAADVVRITPLAERDMVSKQQLDAALAAARSAAALRDAADARLQLLREGTRPERIDALRAELASNEAALASSEAKARDLVLVAPVAGRVVSRRAEPGEVLAAGERALLLAETERQFVRIYVGQEAVSRIRAGMKATATLDAFPDRPIEGQVSAIATQAEYTPRVALTERERADLLFAVRVEFRDTTEILKAGLPVTVRLAPPAQ
jgi:HlyD family secretion protein